MKKALVMVLAAVVALWLATVALAQAPGPAEEPTEQEPTAQEPTTLPADEIATGTTTETVSAGPRISATATLTASDLDGAAAPFVTINLEAGAAIDPFLVGVNGGGPVDVSGLGGDCVGYVAVAPTASVNWIGGADFVKAFFYSDHDPVLVVETPSGDYLCNDDVNDVLLDPSLELETPELGVYHIWVGSFDPGQLVPGLLVLTTKPTVNIGTFDPGALVQRAGIPEKVVEPNDLRVAKMPTMTSTLFKAALPILNSETSPLTSTQIVNGSQLAFDLPTGDAVCTGYIGDSNFSFTWEGGDEGLVIFFEGDDDTSLMVVGPEQEVYCNDDVVAGENLNPLVEIANPTPGTYIVSVGRFDMEREITGQLTIRAGATVTPVVLAPNQE